MAIRSVATTDTLDTFRTTFNSLASTDLGDAATLTTTASTIVGAVNEVNAAVAGDMVQIQTFGHRYNADGSNAYTQFTVTVDTKAATHKYYGSGSSSGFILNSSVAPFIDLKIGNTYRFEQSDSSNSGHQMKFYYDAAKVTEFTTGVTFYGTAGTDGYSQIVVSDTTPHILYYQCASHAYMGNRIDTNSKVLQDVSFVSSTGTSVAYSSTNFAIAQAVALG